MRGGLANILFCLILMTLSVVASRHLYAKDAWYGIQVASFKKAAQASRAVEALKQKGYLAFFRRESLKNQGVWHRVYLASFPNRNQARQCAAALKAKGTISDYHIRTIPDPDQSGLAIGATDQYGTSGLDFLLPVERYETATNQKRRSTPIQLKAEHPGTVHPDCTSLPSSGDDLLEMRSLFSPNYHQAGLTGTTIDLSPREASMKSGSQAVGHDLPSRNREEAGAAFGPRVRPTSLTTWNVGGPDLVPFFSSGRVEDHYGWGKSAGGYDHDLGQEAILGLSLIAPF